MSQDPSIRPLKVCGTCRHWTKKYKGFCERLGQGVGKFHLCSGWEEQQPPSPEGPPPPGSAAAPPAP